MFVSLFYIRILLILYLNFNYHVLKFKGVFFPQNLQHSIIFLFYGRNISYECIQYIKFCSAPHTTLLPYESVVYFFISVFFIPKDDLLKYLVIFNSPCLRWGIERWTCSDTVCERACEGHVHILHVIKPSHLDIPMSQMWVFFLGQSSFCKIWNGAHELPLFVYFC